MTGTRERADVVIVGAGISGLASAAFLRSSGVRALVLEAGAAPGGTMQTVREQGYLVETGPNSALETTPLFRELVGATGIQDQFVYASPAGKNRYILRGGRMRAMPLGPASFVTTDLFSWRAKLRLLAEPFIGRATRDESVAEFVTRRLGREFLDYAVDPFVAGVFAGRPESLSVRSAFPKLYALEEKYGGLVRGMIGGARERKQREEKAKDRAESFSFRDGMQTLPSALARMLGDDLVVNASVTRIKRSNGTYRIRYDGVSGTGTVETRSVILATPADAAASLLAEHAPAASAALRSIEYSPVASIFLAFPRTAVPHALDGFGVLIPARERRRILGALWSSSLFPDRCPDDEAAFTVFVGGARQPEILSAGDDELVSLSTSELASIMHLSGKPVYYRVTRWKKAIPQYTMGHATRIGEAEADLARLPGLYLCSNYAGGISVGDCVMSAHRTADAAGAYLRTSPV